MNGVTVCISADQARVLGAEVPVTPGVCFRPNEIPSTADMVCDFNWLNGGRIVTVAIADTCKEHFFEELPGIGQICPVEESTGQVDCGWGMSIKLGGNPFNISSKGARRSGYHPPPLISRLAVDKGDEVSVINITVGVFKVGIE